MALETEEGESADEVPTVKLDANSRFEWRNDRDPWAVVIRHRGGGKNRKTICTISKGGKYAQQWKEWEAARANYVANRANSRANTGRNEDDRPEFIVGRVAITKTYLDHTPANERATGLLH